MSDNNVADIAELWSILCSLQSDPRRSSVFCLSQLTASHWSGCTFLCPSFVHLFNWFPFALFERIYFCHKVVRVMERLFISCTDITYLFGILKSLSKLSLHLLTMWIFCQEQNKHMQVRLTHPDKPPPSVSAFICCVTWMCAQSGYNRVADCRLM